MKPGIRFHKATKKCVVKTIIIFGFSSVFLLHKSIYYSKNIALRAEYSKTRTFGDLTIDLTNLSASSVSSEFSPFTQLPNITAGVHHTTSKLDTNILSLRNEHVIRKVFSLVYFKGGSTFLGRLFASNPEAFYWFEIVQPIYLSMMGLMTIPYDELYSLQGLRRNQTSEELAYIYENLNKFYRCKLNELPIEMVYQDSVPLSGVEWDPFIACFKTITGHNVWQYFTNMCLKKYLPLSCKRNAEEAVEADCLNAKFLLERKISK